MKKLLSWLGGHRRSLAMAAVGLLVLGFILIYRLGSLTGHFSANEIFLPTTRQAVRDLWINPFNLPLLLSRLVVAVVLPTGGLFASRCPGVLLGLLTAGLFFWVVRRWYGLRVAVFGSAMLWASPWFLHTVRLATPAIIYPFSMMLLLGLYALYHQPSLSTRRFGLLNAVTLLLLYVPGMIWLVTALQILEVKHTHQALSQLSKKQRLASIVAPLVVLIPLIHSLVLRPALYKTVLGLPVSWPVPKTLGLDLLRVPLYIFAHGPLDPSTNLGRLPLIDSFTLVMFAIGCYLYVRYRRSSRSRLLVVLSLLSWVLVAFHGSVDIAILLPIIFILASGGVAYGLHLWLKVFPRNPVARSLGIGLVVIAIGFSMAYGYRQYFVAWPHAPATRAAFERRQ